jgi:ABC-type transport system involved in multi-copper enzyme maturation permease subunit
MRAIFTIALNTYRESIRSKILYSLLFFAVIVVLLSTFFGSVTIGDQSKVIKDFGLFATALFTVAFAVVAGGALLHKELNRKTIYNILSKPVTRWQFLVGKQLGLFMTTSVLAMLMAVGLMCYCYLFDGHFDFLILEAMFCIILQLLIVTAAAIFFSSIVITPLLSGLFTLAIFLAGRSTEYVLQLAELVKGDVPKAMVQATYTVLPHLDAIDISNIVVYGVPASSTHLLSSLVYSICYSGILLALGSLFFARRDFN